MAQAGRKARCKIAQTTPTCKEEMTHEEGSVSDECSQSAYCPYQGRPVTVLISSVLLEKFPSLLSSIKKNPSPPSSGPSFSAQGVSTSVAFVDVDEDTGHTFINYLYTGTFQILKISSSTSSTCGQPIGLMEYTVLL
ncbi:hypothetical protein BDV24DRAFT_169402 [Aspergillus arachidicola]|uniref:Uncharacterized protein n=1 Tax=Aspergillus arachidicola TaxID=656916 RepID=A0A5N6XPW7_9EURO|nr:hypothetical protein BDV24DRAFT_169402 [Aspergillus arachidicola]